MHITLRQFEQIDSLMASLLRMGDFMECAEPRDYIHTENRLYGLLIEAFGKAYVDDFASALECAAHVVAQALLCQIDVLDGDPVQ